MYYFVRASCLAFVFFSAIEVWSQDTDKDEARREAKSHFDGVTEYFRSLAPFDVTIRCEEFEDVEGLIVPISRSALRALFNPAAERCLFGTFSETIPFSVSLAGKLDQWSLNGIVVEVHGASSEAAILPKGLGKRTEKDFDTAWRNAGVPGFESFGIGRFPDSIAQLVNQDQTILNLLSRDVVWKVNHVEVGGDVVIRVVAVYEGKKTTERHVWHFKDDVPVVLDYGCYQDTRRGQGFIEHYKHEITWKRSDEGVVFPSRINVDDLRFRQMPGKPHASLSKGSMHFDLAWSFRNVLPDAKRRLGDLNSNAELRIFLSGSVGGLGL